MTGVQTCALPIYANVLKVSPGFVDLSAATGTSNAFFQIQAVAEGTAVLTLRSSNGVVPSSNSSPLNINVTRAPLQLSNVEVGNNLAAAMSLRLPAGLSSNVAVSVSSSNPGQVLVASFAGVAGQAQISLNSNGQRTVTFYVVGLANSGQIGRAHV